MVDQLQGWKRSAMCGELNESHVGQEITLMGWIQKRRDLGGLIFADLRDRSGIVQVRLNPEPIDAFAKGESLRSEYVIALKGSVCKRPQGQENPDLNTGAIEIEVKEMKILSEAETTPFYITSDVNADESLRLKYRYLDLRRNDLQKCLMSRHRITMAVRNFLDTLGFIEIETPIMTKSTPEGARDYLVPSRVNPGNFYALPQSPQLFKQLLMMSGYDRYFQIAKCFRDEDLRADRQPEFTQIDIEMSFVDEKEVQTVAEEMVRDVFKKVLNVNLKSNAFVKMTYKEAMDSYGTDKPDVRFGMQLQELSDIVVTSKFKVFSNTVSGGGVVKSLTVKNGGNFSRKQIDELTTFVKKFGAKGLAWIEVQDEGVRSPIAKFLSDQEVEAIVAASEAEIGDLILIIAADYKTTSQALGQLRLHLGQELNLIDEASWAFLWVVDFPLLEYDEDSNRYVAAHHPFTMPKVEDLSLLDENPGLVKAQAYDLVLNGSEIGGGSIRINDTHIQEKMFKAIGMSNGEAREKFGFFLDALKYGTPPHGGIAFGLDRLVMEMLRRDNIRDVIAFPKTTSATSLMTGAPGKVSDAQLKELKIKTVK